MLDCVIHFQFVRSAGREIHGLGFASGFSHFQGRISFLVRRLNALRGGTGLHRHEMILVTVCWSRRAILSEHSKREKGEHETSENFQWRTLFG